MIAPFELLHLPRIHYQAGLAAELGHEAARLGATRALVVVDESIEYSGLLDNIRQSLHNIVEIAGIFTTVASHATTIEEVEHGAAFAQQRHLDSIIAIGGGSAIDAAKCIRLLLCQGSHLYDYMERHAINPSAIPLIAMPTTAGSGSEVTPFATIHDRRAYCKRTLSSAFLAPQLALLDPLITRTLPEQATAAAGVEALANAIEAFTAGKVDPISQSLALSAIDMIANHLRAAIYNGEDIDARSQMLVASCMAGMAASNGALGVVQALTHAITGLLDVDQGDIIAALLPYGMIFNSTAVPNRYTRIARALGVNAGGRSEGDVIADGIAAVRSLTSDCFLPTRLRDTGVTEQAFSAIVDIAFRDPVLSGNPRAVTPDNLMALLCEAW